MFESWYHAPRGPEPAGSAPWTPLPEASLVPFELYDDLSPGGDGHYWPLQADLTRDESIGPPSGTVHDDILKNARAYGTNHGAGIINGARGWGLPMADGGLHIVAIQKVATLCFAKTTSGVAAGDATFRVDHLLAINGDATPVSGSTSLEVANNAWSGAAGTWVVIGEPGMSGQWRLVSAPIATQPIALQADARFDAATGTLEKKSRTVYVVDADDAGAWETVVAASPAASDEQRVDATVGTPTIDRGTSVFGQVVHLTATVAKADSTVVADPSGNVTFISDGTPIGSGLVGSGGVATLDIALPANATFLYGLYDGDSTFNQAYSGPLSVTVNRDATTTTLTSSSSSFAYGSYVTLAVTVAVTAPGTAAPAGLVTIYDGSTQLRTVRIASGSASVSDIVLHAGTHSALHAVYAPDSGCPCTASTSSNVAVAVTKAVLSGTVRATTKIYGAANPAFAIDWTGFVWGDTAYTALTGDPAYTCAADETSTVGGGPYAISAAAGTLAADDYSLTFHAGQLTITRAPLVIAARSATMAQRASLPNFTGTVGGIMGSDSLPYRGSVETDGTLLGSFAIHADVADPDGRVDNYTKTTTDATLTVTLAPS